MGSIGISKIKCKSFVVILRPRIQVVSTVLVCSWNKNSLGICYFSPVAITFHVYELVLKCVFEIKIQQVTTSPDFSKSLKKVGKTLIPIRYKAAKIVESLLNYFQVDALLDFYRAKLKENIARDDYRELIELFIVFLSGDVPT